MSGALRLSMSGLTVAQTARAWRDAEMADGAAPAPAEVIAWGRRDPALARAVCESIELTMPATPWAPERRHTRADVRLALACTALVLLLAAFALRGHLYGNRPAPPPPCGDASSPTLPAGCLRSREAPHVLP